MALGGHGGLTGDALRLEALSQFAILDTAPEQGFDDIVALATQLCETPVALVSLVDRDRQWFKARVGFEPCETDLDSSVCRHALGRTDILEIEDLTADERTVSNPLVTHEPHLRFYAGAPLNTRDGQTLGTLCVIDKVPRPRGLTAPQRAGLRALANQVVSQLELRRSIDDREATQKAALAEAARLEAMIATQQAVAAADADVVSVFQVIVEGALGVIDAAEGAVIEVRDGEDLVYDAVSGTSFIHKGVRLPLDRTLSGRAVREERPFRCSDTQTDPEIDHTLARHLGIRSMVVVPVTRRGETVGALKVQSAHPDAFSPRDVVMTQMLAGLVASAVGDVSEAASLRALREAETRYRQTFESVTEFAVIVTDRNGLVTDWNTGAECILGWTADEMRGHDVSRFFTPEDRAADRARVEMTAALRDGRGIDERWHLRKDGSRFFASGDMMPLSGDDGEHIGFVKILRDRTAQKLAEAAVEASERRYRTLYEAIDEGFCILEVRFDETGEPADYRFLEVNPAFEQQTGLHGAVGRWMKDIAPEHESHWFEIYGRIAQSGRPERFEQHAMALGDRWFEVYAYPVGGFGSGQVAVLFNDVSERKRAVQDLAASEMKWRSLFQNLQEGFILGQVIRDAGGRIVDWRYEEVNAAWGELVGIPSTKAAGRTVRDLLPDVEDAWVNEFADVVETKTPVRFTRQVGGLERWYDGVCQPVGDDRFTVIFLEVTDRVLAERRRDALKQIGEALALVDDPDAMAQAAEEVVGRTLNVGRVGYGTVLDDGETLVVRNDWTADRYPTLAGTYRIDDYGGYAEDLRQGRIVVVPDIRLDLRTAADTGPLERVAVRSLVNVPIVERGRTVAVLYINDDAPRNWTEDELAFVREVGERVRSATERARSERARLESDERYRTLVENVDVGICILQVLFDADDRPVDYLYLDANPAFEKQSGITGVVGRRVLELVPNIEQYWPDLYGRVAVTGVSEHVQYESPAMDRWFDIHALRVGEPEQRRVAVLFADISESRRLEEQQRTLNHELAHRMKNSLAMVQAITTQTLRQVKTMEEGRNAISARLIALGRAQDILTHTNFMEADVGDVVRAAVAPHQGAGDRISWSGPHVALTSQQALGLSLAIHELATNAAKYGALSNETGRVAMSWTVANGAFGFDWIETGGPHVVAPDSRGFGSRLIERIVASYFDGEGRIEFDPVGIRFRLTGAAASGSVAA